MKLDSLFSLFDLDLSSLSFSSLFSNPLSLSLFSLSPSTIFLPKQNIEIEIDRKGVVARKIDYKDGRETREEEIARSLRFFCSLSPHLLTLISRLSLSLSKSYFSRK